MLIEISIFSPREYVDMVVNTDDNTVIYAGDFVEYSATEFKDKLFNIINFDGIVGGQKHIRDGESIKIKIIQNDDVKLYKFNKTDILKSYNNFKQLICEVKYAKVIG